MALFNFFKRNETFQEIATSTHPPLIIDLGRFTVGNTPLGQTPWPGDFFANPLKKSDSLENKALGYHLQSKNNRLESAFLTIQDFKGTILNNSSATPLSIHTTISDIQSIFGDPYWTDEEDEEVILFYEYQNGTIELQFEFPDSQHLSYITLGINGVLSNQEQRDAYGITKPWPP